jgi:repressor LexA
VWQAKRTEEMGRTAYPPQVQQNDRRRVLLSAQADLEKDRKRGERMIVKTMDHLTKSQQKVYDFLRKEAPRGVPPTVREICAATGLRSTSTVHAHLKTLERLGYITRDAGLNRSIRLEGSEAAAQVPILGKVTAGIPILAVEDIEGYIPFPQKEGKELFALHVSGLSMRDAGILDGDYVVAEKTPTSSDGEIVVAMIEEEATVKRFYREGSRIRLQPENPDFEPIYAENVFILGKVIAVVRYY